jgi:hypothetical protein
MVLAGVPFVALSFPLIPFPHVRLAYVTVLLFGAIIYFFRDGWRQPLFRQTVIAFFVAHVIAQIVFLPYGEEVMEWFYEQRLTRTTRDWLLTTAMLEGVGMGIYLDMLRVRRWKPLPKARPELRQVKGLQRWVRRLRGEE